MSLNKTPSSNRLHIGIFGKRNTGKSSIINMLTNQEIALVSNIAGTTTDPVLKAMEVTGIGACTFIDTAGFDDIGELGELRIKKTKQAVLKTDIAILVFTDFDFTLEKEWIKLLKQNNIPIIAVINKIDEINNVEKLQQNIKQTLKLDTILISTKTKQGKQTLLQQLARNVPSDYQAPSITAHLVEKDDVVMLVTPIDSQAPKGRLILPQVQTIRDLLDNSCVVITVTPDQIKKALSALKAPPKLVITDSQVFKQVYELIPKQSLLTSFSVLFASFKGDIDIFKKGAKAVEKLKPNSKVLIAEACTHAPATEDIGTVKIPTILKNKYGGGIQIDVVSGIDFPENLTQYDLIVHCGGCMFNKKYLLSRIAKAEQSGVPITNYGVLLAKLTGILDKIKT